MTETLTSAGATAGSEAEPPFVSVVVPYFNPGTRLRPTIDHLVRVLHATGASFEVITVSDGSTDGSPQTLDGVHEGLVRRVAYTNNVGKGHALRTGLAMSRGRYVGFIDADGDITPDLVASFLSLICATEPDLVIGSKRHPASSVRWTPLRRLYSWAHQCLIRGFFRLDVKDTQVGIKLMDRRVAVDVLPLLREDRFALDLELLVLARRLGYTKVLEAPVRIEERLGSTITAKRAWRLLLDTLGIYVRLSVRHEYDAVIRFRSGAQALPAVEPAAGESRPVGAPGSVAPAGALSA